MWEEVNLGQAGPPAGNFNTIKNCITYKAQPISVIVIEDRRDCDRAIRLASMVPPR